MFRDGRFTICSEEAEKLFIETKLKEGIAMPPEYVTKEEYEKLRGELRGEYEKLREKHEGELFKLKKQFQERMAREEEREKLVSRFWMERVVYISIIIAAITFILTAM